MWQVMNFLKVEHIWSSGKGYQMYMPGNQVQNERQWAWQDQKLLSLQSMEKLFEEELLLTQGRGMAVDLYG